MFKKISAKKEAFFKKETLRFTDKVLVRRNVFEYFCKFDAKISNDDEDNENAIIILDRIILEAVHNQKLGKLPIVSITEDLTEKKGASYNVMVMEDIKKDTLVNFFCGRVMYCQTVSEHCFFQIPIITKKPCNGKFYLTDADGFNFCNFVRAVPLKDINVANCICRMVLRDANIPLFCIFALKDLKEKDILACDFSPVEKYLCYPSLTKSKDSGLMILKKPGLRYTKPPQPKLNKSENKQKNTNKVNYQKKRTNNNFSAEKNKQDSKTNINNSAVKEKVTSQNSKNNNISAVNNNNINASLLPDLFSNTKQITEGVKGMILNSHQKSTENVNKTDKDVKLLNKKRKYNNIIEVKK